VIEVLVRIQHLRDLPVVALCRIEALLMIQRIDRHGLAGFGAHDQVIEISVGVTGPDLFYDHQLLLGFRLMARHSREGGKPVEKPGVQPVIDLLDAGLGRHDVV
jgi:hypothetical protein